MRKPDPARTTIAIRMYGGIAPSIASTCATVSGGNSSSGMDGSVIRLHGVTTMTLPWTAAVMTRTRTSWTLRTLPGPSCSESFLKGAWMWLRHRDAIA